MRRPILNRGTTTGLQPQVQSASRTTVELTGLALERRLRQKRSGAYVEAMCQLDATGAVCDRSKLNELLASIQSEFPELKPFQFPIGIISKCYLGQPYEVHTLSIALDIVEHYKRGEALPDGMEKGRSLAIHPGYAFIEIYTDSMCAVDKSGNVSMIKG